ncbi:MAG: Acetylglutamate kinase [Anaerolineales bacterium]|nr:Acetylglutamate kinase [Anaerolineales bacterium]
MKASMDGRNGKKTVEQSTVVLKVSGSFLDNEDFLAKLAETVAQMDERVVIVHGGGKEIASLQRALGLTPRYVDGLRATDDDSLAVVEMVLSGRVNKRLVARLMATGQNALGLSGVDHGLVRVEKMVHPAGDLGWVGRIMQVNAGPLRMLLQNGIVPVVSPVSLGFDGNTYNVNADHVATAIARALRASALYFLTDVDGVLVKGQVINTLASPEAEALIGDGTIRDGMVPKVRSALDAVTAGVREARIIDLAGLAEGGGTAVIA